jgi:hypothetical protein
MATSAKASSHDIKKHKRIHRSARIEAPRSSSQPQPYYANPADNPDRKVSY